MMEKGITERLALGVVGIILIRKTEVNCRGKPVKNSGNFYYPLVEILDLLISNHF